MKTKELGDFQTPIALIEAILECLQINGKKYPRVFEPACGQGNFIQGLINLKEPPLEIQGTEIQKHYIQNLQTRFQTNKSTLIKVKHAKLFDLDLKKDLHWKTKGSLLVIGNPPWITNSKLGTLESQNLPQKTNLKKLTGLEAITGSANFDLTEYIWIKLIQELVDEQPTIVLICKRSVARKVLQFAFENSLPILASSLWLIDAKKWFNAAVSACLFKIELGEGKPEYQTAIYDKLDARQPSSVMGIVQGKLVADCQAYQQLSYADGICPFTWRQGVKHDAASVMELAYNSSGILTNKLGEEVTVESEYIYPLLKSTDLFKQEKIHPNKTVIITQKALNEDTYSLQQNAPNLWKYLTQHQTQFSSRKSSIYQGKPPFSMFGVGEYTFSSYKVAISGFHKIPRFRGIGLFKTRPILLDDTCYFIPCSSPEQAAMLVSIFNHSLCLNLIQSFFFSDAKRPITKKLLQRINVHALLNKIGWEMLLKQAEVEYQKLIVDHPIKPEWSTSFSKISRK